MGIIKLQIVVVLLLVLGPTYGQQNYSKVKVDLTQHSIREFAALGVEADHGNIRQGRYIINDYSESEIELIKKAGFDVEILVDDVISMYSSQSTYTYSDTHHTHISSNRNENCDVSSVIKLTDYKTPDNYTFGSMGGYLTFDELLVELDSMHSKYPNLITARSPMSEFESIEGRPLLYVKISDNPNLEEAEPEMLYTALHHAREPNSLSQLVFYMWYLLENYDSDESIKYIVDNTALYFAPCINPDGYVYNESTNPNGGGLWRKNRRDNGDGNFGVDLNRNYGYKWGNDNSGSSPNSGSDTYRGTEEFSEPELKAVKSFCEAHDFQIALNYHTYSNLLIHPWGYSDTPTEDHSTFKAIGSEMIKENHFFFGTGIETVGYNVNGDSDDWMYGSQNIFSMTPEVGPGIYGFWPPETAIDSLNKTAMYMNIVAAKSLLPYIINQEISSDKFIYNSSNILSIRLHNIGLKEAEGTVVINELTGNSNFEEFTNTKVYSLLEEDTLNFNYVVEDLADTELVFLISISSNGILTTDTIRKKYNPDFFGLEVEVSMQDSMNTIDGWESEGLWGLSTNTYYSAPSSLTDSPNGEYLNNDSNITKLISPIDLASAEGYAVLRYKAKWDIEKGYDYAQIMISTDEENYIPQCGKYTIIGNEAQDEGKSLYDGSSDGWVEEEIDLSDYLGQEIFLGFRLVSDFFSNDDGIYIDDIEVVILKDNVSTFNISEESISIRPNPVTNSLFLDIQGIDNDNVDIAIYDINGTQLYFESRIIAPRIDMSFYMPGIYFIEIMRENRTITRKRIIKI